MTKPYYFFIFTCDDIGFTMVTKMISQLQESFSLRRVGSSFQMALLRNAFNVIKIFHFFIRILTLCNTKYKYYCFYFSFRTWYPSFITFFWQAFSAVGDHFDCTILLFQKWIKKSCLLSGNFISVYTINRTLHGCLGIRILSFHAESVSHSFASLTCKRNLQHSKIKFVSPRGYVVLVKSN